jgi:hypothetical protein
LSGGSLTALTLQSGEDEKSSTARMKIGVETTHAGGSTFSATRSGRGYRGAGGDLRRLVQGGGKRQSAQEGPTDDAKLGVFTSVAIRGHPPFGDPREFLPITPRRLEVAYPERHHALDAVRMLITFDDQPGAFPAATPCILLRHARHPDHAADPALAAIGHHQRTQQPRRIQPIGLGAARAARRTG